MALKDYLKGVAFGFKYLPNFGFDACIGDVVDDLLYSENTYFGHTKLPKVNLTPDKKTIISDTNNLPRISISYSEIQASIMFNDDFKIEDFGILKSAIQKNIIDGAIDAYKIQRIYRMGYAREYHIARNEILDNLMLKLSTTPNNQTASKITTTIKKTIPEKKEGVNDSHQIHHVIIKDAKGYTIKIDFQKIFSPPIDYASGLKFKKFCDEVELFNEIEVSKWLGI